MDFLGKELLLIVNPVAGKQKVRGLENEFHKILKDGGFNITRV